MRLIDRLALWWLRRRHAFVFVFNEPLPDLIKFNELGKPVLYFGYPGGMPPTAAYPQLGDTAYFNGCPLEPPPVTYDPTALHSGCDCRCSEHPPLSSSVGSRIVCIEPGVPVESWSATTSPTEGAR